MLTVFNSLEKRQESHLRGAKTAPQLTHAGRKASWFSPFHQKDFMMEAPVEEGDGQTCVLTNRRTAVANCMQAQSFDENRITEQSALNNTRTDKYGGSFESGTPFLIEVVRPVRAALPRDRAPFVRLSVLDHHEQGWTVEDNTKLTGAVAVNYTEPCAVVIKKEISPKESFVGVVGGISDPKLASDLIETGKTDVVLIARGFLRNAN
ncbi:hypothetical protein BJ742DRAFT_774037 [Cladochytrium replicatum]|nr:hypothetical protein BJ742DRAFT_774037 [Cladochytrium replicatum]